MSLYETRSRSILDALDVPRDMSVHAGPNGSVVPLYWGCNDDEDNDELRIW